jgi:hypothetical protein
VGIASACADRLVTDGVGTLTTDLFIGLLPEEPDTCVAVFEYGGLGPVETFGDGGISLDRPQVQVLVRAADYETGLAKAVAARVSLSALVNVSLSGLVVLRVAPQSSVNFLGNDKQDRPMFSVSFAAVVDV